MKRLIAAFALLALSACAGAPTVYGPAVASSEMGYREQRLENDRYRVSFRANADLKPPQVEDLALRRAAELALQNGAQWFTVVTRSTDLVSGGQTNSGPSLGIGGSSGSYGSAVGVGLGFNFGADTRQYQTSLEILLGRGAKPSDPAAYDAQQMLDRRP
ncbi:MAG: hypothetical protein Q8R82_23200 [Hyphomonadaceae bacterium]|nr:hypothetical protein [Hyphomonadaceae bacterium]